MNINKLIYLNKDIFNKILYSIIRVHKIIALILNFKEFR